jgi:dihydropteroate synthase
MGVVNVTPDSFSDGGDFFDAETAIRQGLALVKDGADILDIGGESVRPGSDPISEALEKERVLPVITALVGRVEVPISIDTCKAGVAEAALATGASMINDISAGRFDPEVLRVAGRADVPLVLMHMKGRPRTMQDNPVYQDLIGEISSFLEEAAARAEAAGVRPEHIIIDPGIGFGKTFDHNLVLINRLEELLALGRPLLLGPSRKAFLGAILNGAPPKERDVATAAILGLAAYKGAHILRTHNVDLARQALLVAAAVKRERVSLSNDE